MLWLYLTALVILIGGTMNAVLQEFTDPETAAAGQRKAAAKELVEHPDAELPEHLVKEAVGKSKVDMTDGKTGGASTEKTAKKRGIKLSFGTFFKVLLGLLFDRKKR